jgi:hypothetical protein
MRPRAPPQAAASFRRGAAVAGLFGVLTVVFVAPLLRHPTYLGVLDWDMNLFKHAAARITLLEFGQFPLWNPWQSGGAPALGHPESRFLSPTFALILLFGPVVGVKLEIAAHTFAGLTGAYLLAREHDLDVAESVTAALLFMLSGMFAIAIASGMSMFMSGALVPWWLLFYERSKRALIHALAAGAVAALVFFGGGVQFAAMLALFAVVVSALEVACGRARLAPALARLAVFAGSSAAFAAVKLLPALDMMRRYPRSARIASTRSGYSVGSLVQSLTDRDLSITSNLGAGEGFWTGGSFLADENGMYVGVAGLVLIAAGVVAHGRRLLPLTLAALAFVWLAFGDRPPLASWPILRRVFPFDAMRVAQRFRFVFMAQAALFGGLGLGVAREAVARARLLGPRAAGVVAWVLAAALAIDLVVVNARVFADAFPIPPPPLQPAGAFRQVSHLRLYGADGWMRPNEEPTERSSSSSMYPAVLSNVGTIHAADALMTGHRSPAVPFFSPRYRGEAYLEGTTGEVRIEHFSPNRVSVHVRSASRGTLVWNQNYDGGWRWKRGDVEGRGAYNGLLAAEVEPGAQRVVFTYLPRSFIVGLCVTLLAIAGALVWVGVRWTTPPRAFAATVPGRGLTDSRAPERFAPQGDPMTPSRLPVRRLAAFFTVALLAGSTVGCAPQILGAQQVGGHEPAAWIYIKTDDRSENGVFRCHDSPQGPACTKAKMRY